MRAVISESIFTYITTTKCALWIQTRPASCFQFGINLWIQLQTEIFRMKMSDFGLSSILSCQLGFVSCRDSISDLVLSHVFVFSPDSNFIYFPMNIWERVQSCNCWHSIVCHRESFSNFNNCPRASLCVSFCCCLWHRLARLASKNKLSAGSFIILSAQYTRLWSIDTFYLCVRYMRFGLLKWKRQLYTIVYECVIFMCGNSSWFAIVYPHFLLSVTQQQQPNQYWCCKAAEKKEI